MTTNAGTARVRVEISAVGSPEAVERVIDVEVHGDGWNAPTLSAFARQVLKHMGARESSQWAWTLMRVGDDYRVVVDLAKPRQMAISDPVELPPSLASSEPGTWSDDPNYADPTGLKIVRSTD